MEKQTFASLFGPLDRKYCDWFYYLSLVAFIFMVLTILALVMSLFSKKAKSEHIGAAVYGALMYAAFYFQNRLLYTMCLK
tara:strand:- start:336 stop:575 length:240 start_codon:yes stop_codon:yes gene_type:complete